MAGFSRRSDGDEVCKARHPADLGAVTRVCLFVCLTLLRSYVVRLSSSL